MAIPVLSPANLIRYQNLLRFHGFEFEKSCIGAEIPTYFSNMIGWEKLVQAVARAYATLPGAERSKTAIPTNTYAPAGAIDLLGAKLGLPKAVSGHENYALWVPRWYTREKIFRVGFSGEDLEANCATVDQWSDHDLFPSKADAATGMADAATLSLRGHQTACRVPRCQWTSHSASCQLGYTAGSTI